MQLIDLKQTKKTDTKQILATNCPELPIKLAYFVS
jgi:hypothetical protein